MKPESTFVFLSKGLPKWSLSRDWVRCRRRPARFLISSGASSRTSMQRRSFLKTGALAGSAFLFSRNLPSATTAADDAVIEIMLDEPLGTISPLIYSHFTEELGAVIYDGVWVGEKSKIANTRRYPYGPHRENEADKGPRGALARGLLRRQL